MAQAPAASFNFNETGDNYFNTLEVVVGKSTIATTISPTNGNKLRLDMFDYNHGETINDASFVSRLVVINKYNSLAINIDDLGSVGVQQTLIDLTALPGA